MRNHRGIFKANHLRGRKKKISFNSKILLLLVCVTFVIVSVRHYKYTSTLQPPILMLEDGTYVNTYTNDKSLTTTLFTNDNTFEANKPIPRIIWQTAKSHKPAPPASQKIINSWKKLNPEWRRHLLDDEELEIFMRTHFNNTVVESFLNLPLPVMRADFFRVAVMYYEGGIYADVDVELKQPIQKWDNNAIDKCEVVIGMENAAHICNWGFAGRRNHLLFKLATEYSIERWMNKTFVMDEHLIHGVTGPGLLTDALFDLAKEAGCAQIISPEEEIIKKARAVNDWCRDLLKEKYNVCLYDRTTQEGWFENHYLSQKKELQSEDFVSSWIQQRDEQILEAEKKQKTEEEKKERGGLIDG